MHNLKDDKLIHISDGVLRSLTQNRITTVLEFLQEDLSKITAITKLNLSQVLAVRSELFSKYAAPLISGTTLLDKGLSKKYLNTGIARLDSMLEGGIPIGYIGEFCGLADTGKTQLCLQLAINCVKNNSSSVLYIDTKGDFSAIRIQKTLAVSGFSHKDMASIMYRIRVAHIWTLEEAIELLQRLKNKSIEIDNLSLIILDSLPCLMLQFLGDDNRIGLSMLNTLANCSRYLCKERDICMIFVNIQTRWVDQDLGDMEDEGAATSSTKEIYKEKRNRCLGKYWQNIPNLVLLFEKLQNNDENISAQVNLSVMKSNDLRIRSRQCSLQITDLGVT